MAASIEDLVALLDLETIDLNLFRGGQLVTERPRVFGGQVAAQALVAAARTCSSELAAHSLHLYFLRPGDTTVPIIYDVDPVRDGRSFATRRVLARQHGRPIFTMTASFQIHEEGFEHQDEMPTAPPPEECVDPIALLTAEKEEEGGAAHYWLKEWAGTEVRFIGDSRRGGLPASDKHPARAAYWFRVNGSLPDDPLIHQAALTYMSDMTLLHTSVLPHTGAALESAVQAASIDHALWFHRPFRADEWLLFTQRSPSASGARGLIFGQFFTQTGILVASAAQEGLIRPKRL
ncbi:MAG: acyl-CoA thioesterase II [Nocardioidaceae bacterium]|nr:MAG: acyl-CoA thioesterase II [Nocardioidaceae bacterium]